MKKVIMSVAIATAALTMFGSSAQAQPMADLVCAGNSEAECVCPQGTHRAHPGQAISASNPCVANVAAHRYADVCVNGAMPTRGGGCECPPVGVSARNERVEVLISRAARRQRGLSPNGRAISCDDPMATGTSEGSNLDVRLTAVELNMQLVCTDPQTHVTDCQAAGALIHGIRNAPPGAVTINYGGNSIGIQEAFELIVAKFGELEEWRHNVVDPTLHAHGAAIANHEGRITALEHRPVAPATVPNGDNSFGVRLGGEVRVDFAGPATVAFGPSLELLFRPGHAPLDLYTRGVFGGQYSGYHVGSSLYVMGGAGLAFYLGDDRDDVTLQAGFLFEDLLEPFSDSPGEVQGSHLGIAYAGEVAAEGKLGHGFFFRLGVAVGSSERYRNINGALNVIATPYVSPSVAISGQF